MPTRVLLADDHEYILEGVRSVLERNPGIEVIGMVGDGSQAVQLSLEQAPDIAIIDLSMPVMGGIEATRLIVAERPDIKVIILSMDNGCDSVMGALEAGASGYVLKEAVTGELVRAIGAVMGGQVYLCSGVSGIVVDVARSKVFPALDSDLAVLTTRECEVLQLLAQGMNTKKVAFQLLLSEKTVGAHRRHIMDKLGIDSIAGLIKFAIRKGLVSTDS